VALRTLTSLLIDADHLFDCQLLLTLSLLKLFALLSLLLLLLLLLLL